MMSTSVEKPSVIQRVVTWIFGSIAESRVVVVASDLRSRVPLFLIPRAPESLASARSLADCDFARTLATWVFSSRLRSVATQNVPKSLKGPRRRQPGGKVMPKKAPRVLKRYTQGLAVAHSPLARARAYSALPTSAEVVMLRNGAHPALRTGTGVARQAA